MNTVIRLAVRSYALLIRFYPRPFREEFGAEMTAVFAESVRAAAQVSKRRLLLVLLRELWDYPFALLREHGRRFAQLESNIMQPNKKPQWFFYPLWIILTMLCVPLTLLPTIATMLIVTAIIGDYIVVDGVRHITEDYLSSYIYIPLVGLLTGFLQYLLLRRYLPRMGWWVFATAGGWLVGLLLAFGLLKKWKSSFADIDVVFVLLGLSIGVGQWLLLRRRLSHAAWWIGANLVGWGLLILLPGNSIGQFGLLVLGLVPACVTAVALALLMNKQTPAYHLF